MEEKLALRIQLFRETGQVRAEVAEFVGNELETLAVTGRTVTEETAGMLTSHLMMALTRLVNGEALAEFPTDESVAAELADRPEAVELAEQIAGRALQVLGALLPRCEINFLAMHLAVLDQRSPEATAARTAQEKGEQP
jgi:PRD domain